MQDLMYDGRLSGASFVFGHHGEIVVHVMLGQSGRPVPAYVVPLLVPGCGEQSRLVLRMGVLDERCAARHEAQQSLFGYLDHDHDSQQMDTVAHLERERGGEGFVRPLARHDTALQTSTTGFVMVDVFLTLVLSRWVNPLQMRKVCTQGG